MRLVRSKNIGPINFFKLIEKFGSPKEACYALPQIGNNSYRLCSKAKIEKEIEDTYKINARFITYKDKNYPEILQNLQDKPPILTFTGNIDLLHKEICSIVGARNSSLHGLSFASKISAELSEVGICICSGLARGIDAASHKSAKENIAVIAGGINHVYPKENEALFRKISDEGIIISENPINCSPLPESFPKRNRIIAGLAKAIIVVEANIKSGSLITAKLGLEYGREIGAVPGYVMDPRSSGCHKLIKDGAALIENKEDILELLGISQSRNATKPANKLVIDRKKDVANHHKRIYKLLSVNPTATDEIAEQAELSLSEVNLILLELELQGNVRRYPGNKFALQI